MRKHIENVVALFNGEVEAEYKAGRVFKRKVLVHQSLQFAAFALFRFFDAAKPGPVAWADKTFKGFGPRGGFGIMFDDIVAAFCALLVIAFWRLL